MWRLVRLFGIRHSGSAGNHATLARGGNFIGCRGVDTMEIDPPKGLIKVDAANRARHPGPAPAARAHDCGQRGRPFRRLGACPQRTEVSVGSGEAGGAGEPVGAAAAAIFSAPAAEPVGKGADPFPSATTALSRT